MLARRWPKRKALKHGPCQWSVVPGVARDLPTTRHSPLATRRFLSPSPAFTSFPRAYSACSTRMAPSPSLTPISVSPPSARKSSRSAPTNTTGATSAAPPIFPKQPWMSSKGSSNKELVASTEVHKFAPANMQAIESPVRLILAIRDHAAHESAGDCSRRCYHSRNEIGPEELGWHEQDFNWPDKVGGFCTCCVTSSG